MSHRALLWEAYRRWGCSVFIPYFASRDDIKSVNNKTGNRDSDRATQGKSNVNHGTAANKQTEPNLSDANKQQLVKNISITVKSSRRKRVRVRPCLNVCQTVEQKCPYMLPGDRAPAYPTQYAGEPTFLCRDLNIEETGEQLRKSNNGPTDCCYDYCGLSPVDGLCARCDPLHNDTVQEGAELDFSSELPSISPSCPSIASAPSGSTQSEQCRLSQIAISSTDTTTSTATTATTTTSITTATTSTSSSNSNRAATTSVTATSTAVTLPSSSSTSSSSRALSSLLRALCALGSVYRTHTGGVHSWAALLVLLSAGTEFASWTKQLVHLLVVL
uniref:Uncharacterized protein n=1 Tax=Anopheles atroparvus TaxID=41427 RepID=A0A182IZC7_ANOAO